MRRIGIIVSESTESEAELIRDPEIQNKIGLQAYFSHLNPQKEEE